MKKKRFNLIIVTRLVILLIGVAFDPSFANSTTIECFIEGEGPLVITFDQRKQTIDTGIRGYLHAADNPVITDSKIGYVERSGGDTTVALIDRSTMTGKLAYWKDGKRSPDLSLQCIDVR